MRGGTTTAGAARATMLGAGGALTLATAAVWLLGAAAAAWPDQQPVQVQTGLGLLATGAAGLVAGWGAVLLAGATVSLLLTAGGSAARTAEDGRQPASPPVLGGGLTGRVAALLLVAASLGAAPAAAEQERPSVVSAQTLCPPGGTATGTPAPTPPEAGTPDGVAGCAALPVPGWTPTDTVRDAVRRATAEVGLVTTTAAAPAAQEVVVHRGDTLWGIAARHLGEHATDQDVAEAWPRWYAANRDVIGSDPDLIRPGQRLVAPTPGDVR